MGVSRGFSLIEVLISISLLSVVALALGSLSAQIDSKSTRSSSVVQVDVVRRNLTSLVFDSKSWMNTVNEGWVGGKYPASKMDCLKNATPCTLDGSAAGTPISDQPFAVLDATNALYYDATNSINGLTNVGTWCQDFGGATCPFRFELRWSANCSPGNCINPQVKVDVQLVVAAGQGIVLNPAKYSAKNILRPAL